MAESQHSFPAFDELPKVDGEPQGSIWGFFDKNGKKDEIGSMHLEASFRQPYERA